MTSHPISSEENLVLYQQVHLFLFSDIYINIILNSLSSIYCWVVHYLKSTLFYNWAHLVFLWRYPELTICIISGRYSRDVPKIQGRTPASKVWTPAHWVITLVFTAPEKLHLEKDYVDMSYFISIIIRSVYWWPVDSLSFCLAYIIGKLVLCQHFEMTAFKGCLGFPTA